MIGECTWGLYPGSEAHTLHAQIHAQLDGPMLQLDVDEAMLSIMDMPDKPWGGACGLAEEGYQVWLERRR